MCSILWYNFVHSFVFFYGYTMAKYFINVHKQRQRMPKAKYAEKLKNKVLTIKQFWKSFDA